MKVLLVSGGAASAKNRGIEEENAPSPKTIIRSSPDNNPNIIKVLETKSVFFRPASSVHNAADSDPSTEDKEYGNCIQMDCSSFSFEFSSDTWITVKVMAIALRQAMARRRYFPIAAFILFSL